MLFAFRGRGVRRDRFGNFLQALPRHPHPRQTFRITTAQKFNQPFAHLAAQAGGGRTPGHQRCQRAARRDC